MARRKVGSAHELDPKEGIVSERVTDEGVRIAVTSEGRKVVLAEDGSIVERLVGPLYAWEAGDEAPAESADEAEG